jgi:hypothetical protein
MPKITVFLPDSAHKKLKILAADQGISYARVIEKLIDSSEGIGGGFDQKDLAFLIKNAISEAGSFGKNESGGEKDISPDRITFLLEKTAFLEAWAIEIGARLKSDGSGAEAVRIAREKARMALEKLTGGA